MKDYIYSNGTVKQKSLYDLGHEVRIISWKYHPQKLLRKPQIHFFFSLPWAAQTAKTEEFMVQNVAYLTIVYRIGMKTTRF